MSNFTTQNLTNERVLVKGTDNSGERGSVVLDAAEWNNIKAHESYHAAAQDFDAEVEEFFAPLMAAAEKLEAAGRPQVKVDPVTFVVLSEGEEATPGSERIVRQLNHDSIVLRLIERGDFDRLVWVEGALEVLEILDDTTVPSVTETLADIVEPLEVSDAG